MQTVNLTRTESIDGRTYTFTVAVPRSEARRKLKLERDRLVADSVRLFANRVAARRKRRGGVRELTAKLTAVRSQLEHVNAQIRQLFAG